MLRRISLALLVVAGLSLATASILYVDRSSAQGVDSLICVAPDGDPSATGSCWDDPIDLATATRTAEPGARIWLRQGIYVARNDPYSAFYLPDGVTITGGFTGSNNNIDERSTDPRETVLDGESIRFTVLVAAGVTDSSVEGLTIRKGSATLIAEEAMDLHRRGGGVFISNSRVTFRDVLIEGNQARFGGAGMYIDDPGDITLENVEFRNNQTTHPQSGRGGGLRVNSGSVVMADVSFTENRAVRGGGMFIDAGDVTITDSEFTGNEAADWGGGFALRTGSLSITDSAVTKNHAVHDGGGLFASELGQSLSIEHSTITGNVAGDGGGGAWIKASEAEIYRAEFNDNDAGTGPGGGLYLEGSASIIRSSRIQGNHAVAGGGLAIRDADTEIVNSLISGNEARQSASSTGRRIPAEKEAQRDRAASQNNDSEDQQEASDDIAERSGGAMLVSGDGSVSLTNVTVAANQSEGLGTAIYHTGGTAMNLQNSIIFGNQRTLPGNDRSGPDIVFAAPNSLDPHQVQLGHSIIEHGCPDGELIQCSQVSRDDPRFRYMPDRNAVPTSSGDFRLWFTSPAIDAGDAAELPVDVQFDLNNERRMVEKQPDRTYRNQESILDLGAFEAQIPENELEIPISISHESPEGTLVIDVSAESAGVLDGTVVIDTERITVDEFRPGRIYREDDLIILDGEALLPSGRLAGIIIEYGPGSTEDSGSVQVSLDTGESTGWLDLD